MGGRGLPQAAGPPALNICFLLCSDPMYRLRDHLTTSLEEQSQNSTSACSSQPQALVSPSPTRPHGALPGRGGDLQTPGAAQDPGAQGEGAACGEQTRPAPRGHQCGQSDQTHRRAHSQRWADTPCLSFTVGSLPREAGTTVLFSRRTERAPRERGWHGHRWELVQNPRSTSRRRAQGLRR